MNIDQHRLTPHISLTEHMRGCQKELAHTLKNKTSIYLDVKFWITLRGAAFGLRCDPLEIELLHSLRELVARNKAFCPISDSTFAEVLKQSDARTRGATAQLIDELSLGITLIPFEERIHMEMDLFLRAVLNNGSSESNDPLVWSKLSYVLGQLHPTGTGFDKHTELAIQKAFLDHMWTLSFSEMIQRIGHAELPESMTFDAIAARLNVENAKHSGELRSFEHCYALEVAGAVDVFASTAMDVICDLWKERSGHLEQIGQKERRLYEQQCRNALFAALKKRPTKQQLRTLHIYACLHAYFRWDKLQKLNSNDFFDFRHAAAALGYCSAFFTEKALRAIITAKHVALDKMFGRHVIADYAEAVDFLKTI
jgi:hypothetical protein